jgi:putative ABC transport system permease protein
VLALASILAPIIVLHGIHTGVIEQMRNRLMQDPSVLVMIPNGSRASGFTGGFIEAINERAECEYAIGRTRDVASEVQLTNEKGRKFTISLESTSEGDPILARNGVREVPVSVAGSFRMVLTHEAFRQLEAGRGNTLTASLGRRTASGRLERLQFKIEITAVLPPQATHMTAGFVDPDFLMAIQNYRDGFAVKLFDAGGDENPETEPYYESFRAYVKDLDSVEPMERWFRDNGVEVKTRSRDIANIRHIDKVLSTIILVITATSCTGFFAFMFSTVHANVRRKWKMLGMLRLLGYTRLNILLFPIFQVLVTGVLGVLLAFGLYAGVSHLIDTLFIAAGSDNKICVVHGMDFVVIFLSVQLLVVLSSIKVALKASEIDPSVVIRET